MVIEYWYPISGAPHDLPAGMDDWSNAGGANKNASQRVGGGRAGPPTNDDDTSYIAWTLNGGLAEQAANIDWPSPVGNYDGVLTASFRHKSTSGTRAINMGNAAGSLGVEINTSSDSSGAYVQGALLDISNAGTFRPGGGSWLATDFQDDKTIFTVVRTAAGGGVQVRVTSVWGQIGYTPPGGAFVFLLQLAGLGALPFVGAMDFSHFLRYLSWRRTSHPRRTILTGDEVHRAWRELREYRAPRFFLPAL